MIWLKWHVVACVAALGLILPGCSSRTKAPPLTTGQKSDELKARLADLPVPLGAQVAELGAVEVVGKVVADGVQITSDDEKAFSFETTLSLNELARFYDEEMEAAGWVKSWEVLRIAEHLVLIFKKPHKQLLLVAERRGNKQQVYLFCKRSE